MLPYRSLVMDCLKLCAEHNRLGVWMSNLIVQSVQYFIVRRIIHNAPTISTLYS